MNHVRQQRLGLLSPEAAITSLNALMGEWIDRARSRREISKLDERTVRDLGLTPSQIMFEAQKPFWRR